MLKTVLDIRPATEEDAALLAEMGGRMFRDAFGESNTPENMDEYINANFSVAQIRLELQDPASIFLLAYQEGLAIGYAKLSDSKTPESISGPAPIELNRIYLDQVVIGKGYGSTLMRACLESAARRGYQTIWLGVWKENDRAITFYEKWGFRVVGSRHFLLGSDLQRDLLMERPVVIDAG